MSKIKKKMIIYLAVIDKDQNKILLTDFVDLCIVNLFVKKETKEMAIESYINKNILVINTTIRVYQSKVSNFYYDIMLLVLENKEVEKVHYIEIHLNY